MHSLEEIDEKLKLFPIEYLDTHSEKEIKKFIRSVLIFDLFSILYNTDSNVDDIAITNAGQEFYKEVMDFNKERYEGYIKEIINKTPKGWGVGSSDIFYYDLYLSSPYHRITRMICNGDAFDRDNIDSLTLLYLIANTYDVLANHGVDVLIPQPDLEQKDFKVANELTGEDLDKLKLQEIEYKIIEEDGKKKYYTRVLNKNFSQKYSEDINRMYDLYYANFEKFNVPNYYTYEILYLFKGNNLFNINVDELLNKYHNVTRDEILTLCLYRLDVNSIIRYLEILDKSNEVNKEKLFEIIKPMHYHFPYITSETYRGMYTKTGRLKPDNHWREDRFAYINNVINGDTLFGNDYIVNGNFLADYRIHDFRSQFYDGYFYYAAALENFFLNQIDVYEKIVAREDYQNILDNLLKIRLYVLNNKMKASEYTNKEMREVINIIKKFIQKYLDNYLSNNLEDNNELREDILNELEDTLHAKEDKGVKLKRNL